MSSIAIRPRESALAVLAPLALLAGLAVAVLVREPLLILVAPIGIGLAVAILVRPFIGVFLALLLSQMDAAVEAALSGLPMPAITALIAYTCFAALIQTWRERRFERLGENDVGLRLGIAFGLILLISALQADHRSAALDYLMRYGPLLALFGLVLHQVRRPEHVRWLLVAILLSTALSGGKVITDTIFGFEKATVGDDGFPVGGADRSSGLSDMDPSTVGMMLMTGAAMALLFAMRQKRMRLLNIAIALVGSVAVTLTYARGPSLTLGVAVIWGVWKFRKDRRLPILFAAVAVGGIAYLPFVPERFWERMSALTEPAADPTLARRLGYNLIGLDLFLERPILGVGPGGYREHYLDFEYRAYPGRDQRRRPLHNTYLLLACETGVFGLAAFLGICGVGLRRLALARKRGATPELRVYAEVLQLGFVCYLLSCSLMPAHFYKYTWALAALSLALGRIALQPPRDAKAEAPAA